MWHPKDWPDVESLIGRVEESAGLDFKRELGANRDTAKDIAAMTVSGGVIVIGIDEDKETGLASAVTPVPLSGIEERLRQIAGTGIAPVPDFDVHCVPNPDEPTMGVVAVAVESSALAPHQWEKRYPYRPGKLTEYLDERAVDRLYQVRRELSGPPDTAGDLIERDFASDLGSAGHEGGRTLLVVRPAAREVRHPAGVWQREALKSAVYRAAQRLGTHMANPSLVRTPNAISDWRPWEAKGWYASLARRQDPPRAHFLPDLVMAATLTYPACLSFEAFWGLISPESGGLPEFKSAREVDVVRELVAMLSVAGEYLAGVEGGGQLLAALDLHGFGQAKCQFFTEMRPAEAEALPDAPPHVVGATRTSAAELRDSPSLVARELIDRWLPAFFRDPQGERDLFDVVAPSNTDASS
jgi:hypothetical protein